MGTDGFAGLNDALEGLLYRKADRDAFLAGDLSRFRLSPGDQDALRTIDQDQLVSAARLARDHVLHRSHRGTGSLVQVFRGTIALWQGQNPGRELDDLAAEFVASRHFDAYRTHEFAGSGISAEEAFFRFADAASVGEAALRLRECARAILHSLLITPRPVFTLPDFVVRAPKGFFVVLPDGPTLLAALDGRFVEGAITPYIGSILAAKPCPEGRHVDVAERKAVEDELARLGLIDPRT